MELDEHGMFNDREFPPVEASLYYDKVRSIILDNHHCLMHACCIVQTHENQAEKDDGLAAVLARSNHQAGYNEANHGCLCVVLSYYLLYRAA